MTLSFSTQINGEPNFFIEKIWCGLLKNETVDELEYPNHICNFSDRFGRKWDGIENDLPIICAPKIHTIRADKKDRWKVGNKIHFVINNRTKNRFQFAPVIPVKSIQKIEIVYWMGCGDYPAVVIDGQSLKNSDVETLAKNDGFDSVEDFFSWFNSDFKGKIIHWTDYSYCG